MSALSPRAMGPCLFLLLSLSAAAAERTLSMEEAVHLALQQNAELRVQEAEVAAARARLSGASLLLQGNPELDAAVGPRRREAATSVDASLQLSQPIEVGGQRGARVEAARGALGATQAQLQARRVALAADVREAFGRTLAAERLSALAKEAVQLAEQSLETAQRRVEAGDASRLELNAARVELGRARREARLAAQRGAAALGELQQFLALDSEGSLHLSGELPASVPGGTLDTAALVRRALEQSPELAEARRELEAAQAEARLSTREAIPTPRLGVAYNREEDAHTVQGTLSLTLPVFNRNQAARGVSAARVAQAEQVLGATQRRVEREVRLAAARLAAAQAAAEDFSGAVVAAAQENLALSNEAYAAGKVDFLQLLLVRRDTLEARRGYIETLEALNDASAQLARAVGSEEVLK